IGQSVAALIIADQQVICGKLVEQFAPDRASPIIFEMIEPIGCLDQWRPLSGYSVGDADAIGGSAEVNFLLQRGQRNSLALARLCGGCPLTNKAKPFAPHRADEPLLSAAVANRLADRIDAAVQRRIRHDPPAPN